MPLTRATSSAGALGVRSPVEVTLSRAMRRVCLERRMELRQLARKSHEKWEDTLAGVVFSQA